MSHPPLEQLARWMQSVITHPGGVREGSETEEAKSALDARVEDLVAPSASLPAEERLGIYARMYLDRLVDVMRDEFPAFVALVGDMVARQTITAYVSAHPSTHYSLNELGARFPEFVRHESRGVPNLGFVADVVRLERTLQESFDAAPAAPIEVDELLAVPADEWGGMTFELTPSLALLEHDYAVEPWYRAFREGSTQPVPAEVPSWTAVYRRDYRVWRSELSYEQFALLGRLARGASLGEALTHLAEDFAADTEAAAGGLQGWFRDWAAEGLFCGLRR